MFDYRSEVGTPDTPAKTRWVIAKYAFYNYLMQYLHKEKFLMFNMNFIKKHRRILLGGIDLVILCAAYAAALFITNLTDPGIKIVPAKVIFKAAAFVSASLLGMWVSGVYRNVWRYARIRDFAGIITGNIVGTAVCFALFTLSGTKIYTICVIVAVSVGICLTIMSRICYIYIYNFYINSKQEDAKDKNKVLIIGAGYTGSLMADEFARNSDKYTIIGFVDDDPNKIGRDVHGVRVLGDCSMIPQLVDQHKIQTIALAIPSITPADKSRIISICSETVCDFKILPGVRNLMSTNSGFMKQLAPIKIEDLLGRDEISFDNREVSQLISGSVCMVTGGGGSIGSELCRQIARYNPKSLIIIDIYENNAYEIQQELIRKYKDDLDLHIEIASVRDKDKLESLFVKYRPDIVFHAAAHKHVPLMETNPEEAVKNNIFGTFNTAILACKYEVKKFVLVSTDKAVNPTNIMGATKRFCEMIVEYFAQKRTKTEYVAVRFGNVLGSNGSVIPLFEKQIAAGGPVTVTHPEIVRYFMTIPEAVSLILQAATLARGGEIFVLDMGEPVKILDLAKKMITLHGKHVGSDIEIEFSGLRPGEKLYEELLMNEEGLKKTSNHKIYIGHQTKVDEDLFLSHLAHLRTAAEQNNKAEVEAVLHESVPTFIRKEQQAAV